MFRRTLIFNRLVALVLIGAGVLPLFLEGDGTALVFFLPMALLLIFSKENCLTIGVIEDEQGEWRKI